MSIYGKQDRPDYPRGDAGLDCNHAKVKIVRIVRCKRHGIRIIGGNCDNCRSEVTRKQGAVESNWKRA